jgi:adenylate kinase
MILFFGPTGAGKSVQGQMMAVRHGWKWLSTGQMLRESQDEAIRGLLKTGELVSDEQTYEVFDQAIRDAEDRHYAQIIVDGFPRTHAQAEWLQGYMEQHSQKIDLVVVFEVPETEIMKRLDLRQREEDTPEVIEKRMNIYRQKMYPVLAVFAEQNIRIIHIDGTGTVGQVHDRIETELEAWHLD